VSATVIPEDAIRVEVEPRRVRPAWRQPLTIVGAAIAALWLVVAVLAPLIAPYDPLAQSFVPFAPPSRGHLFGTD